MKEAPWTKEQADRLNEFQACGHVHEFTCPNRGDGKHGDGNGALVATEAGWICPHCDYTQLWAHEFMFYGAPPMPW